MGITHVMRGAANTCPAPPSITCCIRPWLDAPIYGYLPVVMRDATRKLSKRYGDPSFEDLLDQGHLQRPSTSSPAGWSPRSEREFFTLAELERCSTRRLNKSLHLRH